MKTAHLPIKFRGPLAPVARLLQWCGGVMQRIARRIA